MSLSLFQALTIIGIPSIITTVLFAFFKRLYAKIKKNDEETESVKLGIQALLRNEMIETYNKWIEKGFASIYARESFENCYVQYHSLGANGVMDDIHEKFMALPTEKHSVRK